jgi:hypothetical protein
VEKRVLEVDGADLDGAQLSTAPAGDRGEPYVQGEQRSSGLASQPLLRCHVLDRRAEDSDYREICRQEVRLNVSGMLALTPAP